jgi:hypothetical protein
MTVHPGPTVRRARNISFARGSRCRAPIRVRQRSIRRDRELLSVGDKVVTRFHYSGTHKNQFEGIAPTGRRVNGTGITIQRFQGDRIQETFTNWDALGLMQQLGVVTLPGNTSSAGR